MKHYWQPSQGSPCTLYRPTSIYSHRAIHTRDAFIWESSERGHFKEEYFPPIEIPVVPHTPWVHCNIPIPPGLHKEVCRLIQDKINAGVFKPSNSLYRS